ncbi:hypothetical protein CO229_02200 [Mycoplasmopsis bovirhinis]|uniref:MAG5620 family putative phospho-sugar mutase n=1 Tax=Mycoplasmopsis bovirhinis TaxID=29553 RepID=UPI000C05ADDC|nr:hypothetical protein [Mycoplasmopsis bovirhinis]ATO30916.1 hypothetical protein CO229_02200 [Mycoplasmopsis bovirhinis]
MAFSTFEVWRSLYNNESICKISDFDLAMQNNQIDFNNLVSKSQGTIYGLEFYGMDNFLLDHLNPFSLLAIFSIFLKEINNTKNKKILIATDFEITKSTNLKDLLVRYANKARFETFVHNYSQINEFLFYQTIELTGIPNGIFLSYDKGNDKYYVKLIKEKQQLSADEYEFYLNEFPKIKSLIMLSPSNQSTIINIDKIIKFYGDKFTLNHLSNQGDISQHKTLRISIITSNLLDKYILRKVLKNSGYKVIAHNLTLSNKLFFSKFELRFNKYKTDLIIYLNQANQLKIYAWRKNRYILLREEDLVYLFINYYFLTWKNNSSLTLNSIYLPFYVSKNILNLLVNFKINYDQNSRIDLDHQNVLLSFANNRFSANLNYKLFYSNYDFILKLCYIFFNYKNNNNLFGYKYKKMLESNQNIILNSKAFNFPYLEALKIDSLFNLNEKYCKSLELIKIKKYDFKTNLQHDLLELTFTYKRQLFYIYIFYDFMQRQLVLKLETETKYNLTLTKKLINKLILKLLQHAVSQKIKELIKTESKWKETFNIQKKKSSKNT